MRTNILLTGLAVAVLALIGANTAQAALFRVDFAQTAVPDANNLMPVGTTDSVTDGLDSNFGTDGTNYWNWINAGGVYTIDDSTQTSTATLSLHPTTSSIGNGQGGGDNVLRGGYLGYDNIIAPFSIDLGVAYANQPVTLALYVFANGNWLTNSSWGAQSGSQNATGTNVLLLTDNANGSGVISGVFNTSGTSAGNVMAGLQIYAAEAAVPEPSTFVLGLLGLTSLGFVTLRRNRRRD